MEITLYSHREEKQNHGKTKHLEKKEYIKLTTVLEHKSAKTAFKKLFFVKKKIDYTLMSCHVCIIEQSQETIC